MKTQITSQGTLLPAPENDECIKGPVPVGAQAGEVEGLLGTVPFMFSISALLDAASRHLGRGFAFVHTFHSLARGAVLLERTKCFEDVDRIACCGCSYQAITIRAELSGLGLTCSCEGMTSVSKKPRHSVSLHPPTWHAWHQLNLTPAPGTSYNYMGSFLN